MHAIAASPSAMRRIRRSPLDFGVLFMLLVVLSGVGAAASWQMWHAGRIFTGVSVDGVQLGGMTRSQALRHLQAQPAQNSLPVVSVTHSDKRWVLSTANLGGAVDLAVAVDAAYLVGRRGSLLPALHEQVRSAWRGHTITPPLTVDETLLRSEIQRIGATIAQTGTQERTIGDVIVPARQEIAVDIDATVEAILAALRDPSVQMGVSIPLVVVHADAAPDDPPRELPERNKGHLLLRSETFAIDMALDGATLDRMLVHASPPQVNEQLLREYLEGLAETIDLPARDARLRFDPVSRTPIVLQESLSGRRLDIPATIESVKAALAGGHSEAVLMIDVVMPAVDSRLVHEMGIRELVASGTTYFAGSSASRIHNIKVGAEQFEGVVIAPDGIFSFNEIVRDVSSANGFEDSLIIWGDRTAVGVGGGVCQVSTTVFRAAYEGGFPIVERYNHGYVVDWYGEPGLDATIYTPTVDFKFRNDTGAFLLIEPDVDVVNGLITFNFYGTKPARTVTVGEPLITQRLQPEAPAYVVDASLAPGEQQQVEWEKEGMSVSVTRTIVENGIERTDTLVSNYQPWRAIYLVAPGSELAVATP